MSEFSVLRIPESRPDGQTRVHAHTCHGLGGLEMISCTVGNALGSQIISELETFSIQSFFIIDTTISDQIASGSPSAYGVERVVH